jgi:tetratricopeptide (TPR) repeat protein
MDNVDGTPNLLYHTYLYRVWDDSAENASFFIWPRHKSYNLGMSGYLRAVLACLMALPVFATAQQKPPEQQEQAPPEEDEAEKPTEYSFNPLQADKDVRIGNYYFHKGNYRAAAQRYREATKWNGSLAEAYLRLGEAEEKQRDRSAAREAYEKFVELAADDKRTPEIRKRIEKLPKGKSKPSSGAP